MRLGLFLRNMGAASTPELIAQCAKQADKLGIDDLWVLDHIAIPKEESAGSGGRYVDPLATLAFVAGITKRIGLGVSVLILPYRPPLATAKWIASIQELSNGRLTLGAGVGWMEAEFKAVAVERKRRGTITDETLAFFHAAFDADEVVSNEQKFLFLPRPTRPQILIGGAAPHALDRAATYGDGWMPAGVDPDDLAPQIRDLSDKFASAGKSSPEVIPLKSLPLDNVEETAQLLNDYAAIGVTGIDHPGNYESVAQFSEICEQLMAAKKIAGL
ncbi:MAG: TIGR03619 family F420-dependent LLM class oxidoreductase [Gammaproteobacteria bacterium]